MRLVYEVVTCVLLTLIDVLWWY